MENRGLHNITACGFDPAGKIYRYNLILLHVENPAIIFHKI